MRNRRPIKAKHRYAFRLRDVDEERMIYLRTRYRYKNDTEIVILAIQSLAEDNYAAEQAALDAAPQTMSLGKHKAPSSKPTTKKGRTK